MNKLTKFINKILYALPFGLKAADSEIMGSSNSENDGQTINQEVSDERVGKALLKGEITQPVKELRYRTYKVDDESKNYKYIGEGNAIKIGNPNRSIKHIKFSQECKLVTSDVLEELERVNNYGFENYTLNITYNNPLVKFKFEQFATQIDVDLKNGEKTNKEGKTQFQDCITVLHFSDIPDGYEKKSAPFINDLKRLVNIVNNVKNLNNTPESKKMANEIYSHNEMASSMTYLNFTTYKATNDEPDLISYNFLMPHIVDASEKNGEILLAFKWELCQSYDLKAKFFDATMAEKYADKAPKKVDVDITGGAERIAHCEICGKEINVYDADVTKNTYGKSMCKNCLYNHL